MRNKLRKKENTKCLSLGNRSPRDRRFILCVQRRLFRFRPAEAGQRGGGSEPEVSVQQIAERRHRFTHRESGEDGADAEPVQMAQKTKGQKSRDGQTDHVKGNLDLCIGNMGDLGQLPGKQVCGNNREPAAVGQGDAKADEQIADRKIENLEGQPRGKKVDPRLVDVQQLAEHKAHQKAAEIGGHKLPPEHHQAQHQYALKDICPCAQRQHREHLGEGVGDAGNGGDPRPGVQHQHNAEAVDEHRCRQRQLSPEGLFFCCFHIHKYMLPFCCGIRTGCGRRNRYDYSPLKTDRKGRIYILSQCCNPRPRSRGHSGKIH